MYCAHFGLHRPAFNNTPDPSFYYSTPDHEEALATLQYATLNRKGFVLVTGEVGAGKTLIGRMFIRQIDRQASTAVITHTQLNARQLLAAICGEFELDVPEGATNLQLAERLQEYLLDQFARDRFVVVLLDEGQNLPDESFEALRMLGNLEADDAKLLQVCILGQPELRERFKSSSMRQLDQRLFRRFHLPALNQHQTAEYIQRRLSVAGCSRSDLFTDAALEKIYRGSQGIPRLINRVCDNALLAAYAQGRTVVDDAITEQVLEQEDLRGTADFSSAAQRGDEATAAKLEQIYGSRPEIIEDGEPQGAVSAATMQALHEQVSRTAEHNRVHLQQSVDEARTLCRRAEEQIAAVARAATPVEEVDELRRSHRDHTQRVLEEIAQSRSALQTLIDETAGRLRQTEAKLRDTTSGLASQEAVADLELRMQEANQQAQAEASRTRREMERELAQAREELEARLAGTAEDLSRLSDTLAGWRQKDQADARARAEALGNQAAAIQDIYHSVGRHEDEIRKLSHEAAERFSALADGLSTLRDADAGGSARLEQLRREHEAFARDVLERFEQKASELDELRSALDGRLDRTLGDQQAALAELSRELESESRQLRQIRRRLVDSHAQLAQRIDSLDEKYAGRSELEALRQTQAAQASEMAERIQADRQAVEGLIADLAERFRATQQRLEALSATAQADGADLAELRRVQAEDVASLLRQLEDQRRISQAQSEEALAKWIQAQQEISALRESAADRSALEELRKRQDRQSQEVLRMLCDQRQNLETLIAAANQQCDATMARLDALPANVASLEDVQTLREEARDSKAALQSAIESVTDRCEQTASALRNLEDRAASVDSHLEQLRQDHAQSLDGIVQRLEGQSSEYQQEFDALQQRWAGLRHDLQNLAGSTVPVEKFEAAERLVNRDLDALKRRLDEIADRRQQDVRTLVDVVQRLSERVKRVEEADRPQPVRVELRPQAAEELAELNAAAQSNAAGLRKLLAECSAVGDRLHEASTHGEQVMRDWAEQAGCVREQAEQLRTSAAASGSILQALRKCHEVIDNKLKSTTWHGQLHRAEELTARLEQVLHNYQGFEETVQSWLEQRNHAGAVVKRLEKLLAESARATARLGRVGALMAGAATKSNIAHAVESAREHDEQLRPTRGNGQKTPRRDVEPVAWPKYRTHATAG